MNAPANLIAAEHLDLMLGTQHLLDDVSLGINEGARIGVVGRNGGGKSTLLKVLAGQLQADGGRLTRGSSVTSGVLSQADALDPEWTVRQAVLGDLAEHEWAADARVRDVLHGLLGGLDAPAVGGLEAVVGPMSGGERRRLALAALLVQDPDVLFLDEPTNHLDVEGVAWLAQHLVRARTRAGSALVVITHDRWFLDEVATQTWEVVDGRVHQYEGGYGAFVLARAERERVAAATEERRQNLLRKELAWLRRGAPARTSKPRFRIEAAETLIADEPPPRDSVQLARFATTRLGKDVIDLIDATVTVGERTLLEKVTWRLGPGDRIGLVGVNGAGKSTLLRVLLGEHALAAGKRKVGRTVHMAVLSQELRELDAVRGMSVIDALTMVRSYTMLDGKEISASQLAKRLGFSGPRQQAKVSELSGGERRRLQFVRLLLDEPNVLLLDEPTNDLDIETLQSMEDVLDGWAGTLVVVSHDRYLLERMCDTQLALLGDGALRDLPRGVEQYLELRAERAARLARGGAAAGTRAVAGAGGGATPSGGAASGAAAAASGLSASEQRQAKKDLNRVEKQLSTIATRLERLHAEMAEKANDLTAVTALHAETLALTQQTEELEMEWLELAERLGG